MPLDGLMKTMAINLDPKKSEDVTQSALFYFQDRQQQYLISVQHQVAIIEELSHEDIRESNPDITIRVDSGDWIELVGGEKSFALALIDGTLDVQGGIMDSVQLIKFLRLFKVKK